jgi:acyl carrier protein
MKSLSESGLIELVIQWVQENKLQNGSGNPEITPDTNLLERGLLDSLSFVHLILFLESQAECRINLFDVDPAEFTQVRGLCRIALQDLQ